MLQTNEAFVPHHINANRSHFEGNGDIGRYIFLPGSDGRAAEIAERFSNVTMLPHPRHHNLYLGQIEVNGQMVEVGAVSTGMGCASLDIIVNELISLGAKRFLRVGTAGSMQPFMIPAGSLVVATSSVRDESTSRQYVPIEVPAVASMEVVLAANRAVAELGLGEKTHYGTVHAKDSLYAREFLVGPMAEQNKAYMQLLRDSGVLASEMESSHLFILASLFNYRLSRLGPTRAHRVMAGAILGVIGDDRPFASKEDQKRAIDDSIALSLETIRQLAIEELVP